MSTFDRVDVDDVTFDVSKLSITTTPPGQHSNHQATNQSKSDDQSTNQSKSDDPGFNIILESAEYDDHSKHQSINKSDRRQPNGHTSTDVKRAHPEEASPSNNDDLEPKEHSASSQHNNQLTKQSQHNNQPTNQPTNHSSEHSTKQSESQSHSRKPSEPVNDIEAAKAKAHAERVAKKAAKLARKAEKLTKDDSSLKPVRKDQNFTVSASAPNSPVDSQHSSPVQVTHTLSKHKLLAPPPIKSSRNNLVNAADGSASPMSPPSPYVSPTHPKRKNQPHPNTSENRIFGFDWVNVLDRALEMVFGRNVTDIRSMAPKTLIRHPYVVATIFSFSAMLLVLKSFGIRMMAPLFLISWLLTWLIHHWHVTVSLLGSLTVAWAVKNRDSVVRMYRAVFLPPLTDSFPDCFEYEEIQLADQPKELISKWAKEIDQYTPIEDLIHQPNNQFDPSDSSPTAQNRDTLPQMYSRMSGTAALSLMQCYQQGDLEDCEFHCLRVYSKDASFIANSVKESRNNNIEQDNDDTMGFVFISIKKHYDVSPTLLKIFTPIQVCFPWLCLPALWSQRIRRMMTFRFGVVGFHWPFRSAVFFTKPVEDFKSILELDTNAMAHLADAEQATEHNESMIIQVARTAAFIAVAKRFDTSRPVSERCDFLLYTVATASPVVNSILASGGAPLPILPTYVADLRPVKGQDWQAYKRYLRHQNRKVREGPFENAGGHADLVAGKNMSDEDADTLVEMWHKVAGFRSSRDATSCLMAPTVKFIHELTHNPSGIVNFLALKLNQTVVAASLLFSLGPEVLTSDVAGFNYDALEEAGRKANQQIKAYPVKLAAVIKHGIANGFEYVDFGPTTGPSKMELGCREIALTGGLYYHGTITSIVVSLAACAATSRHTSAGR